MRLPSRRLILSLLLASAIASCGDNAKKKFCDACSSDSECDASDSLACETFVDGGRRCAHPANPTERCP